LPGPEPKRASNRRERVALLIAAALLLCVFGATTLIESRGLPLADDSDEPAYFDEACSIAERGGATGFIRECFRGRYPYDNRHPLVQLAASAWAKRSVDATRPMRAAKVVLTLIAAGMLFLVCTRVTSLPAALAVLALLLVSRNWFMKTRVLCAEPVVYALFFVAWALISGSWKPRGRWLWAGLFAGAAWMAKGTAVLLLAAWPPAAIAWLILRRFGGRARPVEAAPLARGRAAALFCLGFLLVALPLLYRNTVRFGNPLHNRNSQLMWADDWSAHLLTNEQKAGKPLTAWNYLRTHSVGAVAGRMGRGIVKQAPRLFGALAVHPSFVAPVYPVTLLLSTCIVALGLAWSARNVLTWAGLYTTLLVGTGFMLFAWYSPVTYSSRFTATFAAILAVQAARADFRPARGMLKRLRKSAPWLAVALALAASGLMIARLPAAIPKARERSVPMTREFRFLLDWYANEAAPEHAVCFETPYLGPRYGFHWLLGERVAIHPLPPVADFAALQARMDTAGARYLVIERDSFAERRRILGNYFGYDSTGQLIVKRAPPGWRIYKDDPFPPRDFVILRRESPGNR